MGSKMESPMPEHGSNRELAKEFLDVFIEKITTICYGLGNTSRFSAMDTIRYLSLQNS